MESTSCIRYDETLPPEIEHTCPDYGLYPQHTADTACGYLTRGCPNNCPFCIVSQKEGLVTHKVADLSEFWNGQKTIRLMDANLLACRDCGELLGQLADSDSYVDFTQGLDCRRLTDENIERLHKIKVRELHFAWDMEKYERAVLAGLRRYADSSPRKPHGSYAAVYVLTNYDTTHEYDLYRVYTLRDMGYDPYLMVYCAANRDDRCRHNPCAYRQLRRRGVRRMGDL